MSSRYCDGAEGPQTPMKQQPRPSLRFARAAKAGRGLSRHISACRLDGRRYHRETPIHVHLRHASRHLPPDTPAQPACPLFRTDCPSRTSIVFETVLRRPNAIRLHRQSRRHPAPPFRRLDRFAPVVGYSNRFTLLKLTYRNVPIQSTVSVVDRPFDYDNLTKRQTTTNLKRDGFEVALDLANQISALHQLSHLRPLTNAVLREGRPQDMAQSCPPVPGTFLYLDH